MGLRYCNAPQATTGAVYGKHDQTCADCMAWMRRGCLRVLRFRRNTSQPPRAYCLKCAVSNGFAKYEPGKDPAIAMRTAPEWKGKNHQPVKLARFGSKWGA